MERNKFCQKTLDAARLLIQATIIDLWRLMNEIEESHIERDRMSASAIMQEIAYATNYSMAGVRKILIDNKEYIPNQNEK